MQSLSSFTRKRYLRSVYGLRLLLPPSLGGLPYKRVVFLHVPKAAGTSLNHYFKDRFGAYWSDRVQILTEDADTVQLVAARRARYVGGHFGYDALLKVSQNAFCFTFLRNPRARVISLYKYLMTNEGAVAKVPRCDFETFLMQEDPFVRRMIDNTQFRQIASSFDRCLDGKSPSAAERRTALEHLESFDFVGTVENFDRDFASLCRCLEMDHPRRMPRSNTFQAQAGAAALPPSYMEVTPRAEALLEPLIRYDHEVYEKAQELSQQNRP